MLDVYIYTYIYIYIYIYIHICQSWYVCATSPITVTFVLLKKACKTRSRLIHPMPTSAGLTTPNGTIVKVLPRIESSKLSSNPFTFSCKPVDMSCVIMILQ